MLSTGQRFISSGQHYSPFEQLGPDVNNFTVICLGQETCVIKAVHVMVPVIFFFKTLNVFLFCLSFKSWYKCESFISFIRNISCLL